jgi:hypothetical protein
MPRIAAVRHALRLVAEVTDPREGDESAHSSTS